jgi:LmbE family N-acetylglucosaminyl deacetylase
LSDDSRRALAICAHDDDEVIALGGTIRLLADAGVRITTVVLAIGNEGYSRLSDRDQIVKVRRVERKNAQRILGTAECIPLDHHDFENLDTELVFSTIIRAVRAVRPQVVFSHLPTDYIAHRTLARVAPEAIWQAGWVCSLELGAPWKVDRLFQFSVLDLIGKPSHIVDITQVLQIKLEAMRQYISQQAVVPGILDQIMAKARAYGSLIGVQYGEAFMRSYFIPMALADPTVLVDGVG